MAEHFLCPRGHRWQVLADGCDVLPGEWIVCPLCGDRPKPEGQAPPGAALTPAQRLARNRDPDARPWSRRAGLWPVLLGGFVLLVVLPALAWVTVVHWQQQAAERQHLREALERALDAEMRARAALLEAQLRELRLHDLQLTPEEQAAGQPKDGK